MIEFLELARVIIGARTRTLLAQWLGYGVEGDNSTTQNGSNAEVWSHYGFASRPKASAGKVEAIAFSAEGRVVVIGTRQRATQVSIDDGDVILYSQASGCLVKLTAAGQVQITAAAGQNVVINGGNVPVAKEGSVTTGHAHGAGMLVAGPYAVTGVTASATDTIATGAGSQRARVL